MHWLSFNARRNPCISFCLFFFMGYPDYLIHFWHFRTFGKFSEKTFYFACLFLTFGKFPSDSENMLIFSENFRIFQKDFPKLSENSESFRIFSETFGNFRKISEPTKFPPLLRGWEGKTNNLKSLIFLIPSFFIQGPRFQVSKGLLPTLLASSKSCLN